LFLIASTLSFILSSMFFIPFFLVVFIITTTSSTSWLVCALVVICSAPIFGSIPAFQVVTSHNIHRQMDVIISQQSPSRSIGIISRTLHLVSCNLKKIHN
jgi:hypothetical protein